MLNFKTLSLALALAAMTSITPAYAFGARTTFHFYDGNDSIRTGSGGTRITSNGIDYWTSGQPPKKYQIIGVIVDDRGTSHAALNSALDGKVIGSRKIARMCKQNGGHAVIVDIKDTDEYSGRETTTLLVVKYLQ